MMLVLYIYSAYVENADGRSTSKSVLSYGRTDGIRSRVTMEEKRGRWERMVIGRKNRSSSLMRTSYFKIKKWKEGREKKMKEPIWVYLMHPTCAQIVKPPIASSAERVTAVPWFDEGGIFIIIHWQDVHKTPIYNSAAAAAAEYYNNQASAACTEGCTRGPHSSFSSSSFSSSFSSYIKGNCV